MPRIPTDGTFSVWTDPPENMACSMAGFASREKAQQYIDGLERHYPELVGYSRIVGA